MSNIKCSSQMQDSDSIKYFATWSGYSIPKKPQNEIEANQRENYKAYYKAFYQGKLLVKFEKYIDNKLVGYDEYIYWENSKKLKTHITVNELSEKKTHEYSKKGKLLPDSE